MIKYAVIENEYYSAKQLIKFVASVRPDYRLCFCAESVEDTVELLRSSPDLDLIFMDIELVDGDCFDIIRKVEIDVPVIFTTAYSDFAIKAFRMYCIDYILKPLTEEKIGKALDRFDYYRNRPHSDDISAPCEYAREMERQSTVLVTGGRPKSRILISEGDNYFFIPVEDIATVETEDKYVFVHTFNGRKHITDYPNLNLAEEDLAGDTFFRISRNQIINIGAISSVRKYFKGRLKISVRYHDTAFDTIVSTARREAFLSWLGGGKTD